MTNFRVLQVSLTGTPGYVLAALLLLAYVVVALEPFHWNPPRRVENRAAITASGAIRFPAPGLARTAAAPAWLDKAIRLDSLKVRLRARSLSPRQFGPARLFTISSDWYLRNLTIAQDVSDLVLRLRTPETSLNGKPPYVIPGVFETSDWREIELTVRPGAIALKVDGQTVLSECLPKRPLMNWDRGFRLALGNELIGRRPWLGEISQATVLVGDDQIDYLSEGRMQIPSHYWEGLTFQHIYPFTDFTQRRKALPDVVFNFAGFVPLGFVLVMVRGGRGSLLLAVVVCAVTSLGVECTQLCFDGRFPSVADWVLNVLGASLGAWIACRLLTRTDPQPGERVLDGGHVKGHRLHPGPYCPTDPGQASKAKPR